MKRRSPLLFLLIMIAVPALSITSIFGQQDGQDSTKPTRKAPSRPRIIEPPRKIPSPPPYMQPQIFLSGTVIREDGTPPPFGTAIELDCRGSVTREAIVDSSGRFSFQVGDANRIGRIGPDASERMNVSPFNEDSVTRSPFETFDASTYPNTMNPANLMGCELRAQLAGYRSTQVRINTSVRQGLNEIGTIVIYPNGKVRGTTVSAANLLAPKSAQKALKKAVKALRKNKLDEAENLLKSAIQTYSQYGEAWVNLGELYQKRNRNDEAWRAYTRAIETDGLFVKPYLKLGWLASREQKWQIAAEYTDKALDLDPVSYPEMHYLNALANFNLGNLDMAEKRAQQEQRLDRQCRFPQVFIILANIYILRNDTERSIEAMRNYLKHAPNAVDADIVRSRLKSQERLLSAGKN